MRPLDSGHVNLIVVAVRANEANIHNSLGVVDGHHKAVAIATHIEDHAVLTHNARIAIHIFNLCRGMPGRLLGITIPGLKGLLSIGMLFPKKSKRFESDDAHAAIIGRSRIGNNLKLEAEQRFNRNFFHPKPL